MTDHVKAAHSLECAIILICDSINFIEEADISRITRLRHIITQIGHEAEELRLSTLKVNYVQLQVVAILG